MFRIALRAIAFAIIGLGVAAPAYADAQVQNAMRLWTGDLQNAYSATIASLSSGKRKQGKEDIEKLLVHLVKMREMTNEIANAANELAPELSLGWAETQRAIEDFEKVTAELTPTVTKQTPNLSELQSAKAAADSAIPKSLEATKNFGKKYGELMGYVEQANQLLGGDVSGTQEATVEYLVEGNIDDGEVALNLLKQRTEALFTPVLETNFRAKELARRLTELWQPTFDAARSYQVSVGLLQGKVMNDDPYESELEDMQEYFEELKDTMPTSYKEIQEVGNELVKITDDWR
jgi:hypothetical protein